MKTLRALALTMTVGCAVAYGIGSAVAADDPPSTPGWQAPSFSNFADDLAMSQEILGGLEIGIPCDAGNADFLEDFDSPQPVLVGVADLSSGTCVVSGWAYRVLPMDLPFEPPIWQQRATLAPIFNQDGDVIAWFPPPEVLVDNIVVD